MNGLGWKARAMVETRHLQPPVTGPQSDPLLYGVADALARLFPIEDSCRRAVSSAPDAQEDEQVEEPLAA